MNNLFISYDLHAPTKNYERVIAAIQKLGFWARVHKSLWYVKTGISASQAFESVRMAIDSNDSLAVIDATNKNIHWVNLDPQVAQALQDNWYK